ncbi:hypothetical protein V6N11_068325 [Hibiscus sabdariffa]
MNVDNSIHEWDKEMYFRRKHFQVFVEPFYHIGFHLRGVRIEYNYTSYNLHDVRITTGANEAQSGGERQRRETGSG